jgi:hypothetical protein
VVAKHRGISLLGSKGSFQYPPSEIVMGVFLIQ